MDVALTIPWRSPHSSFSCDQRRKRPYFVDHRSSTDMHKRPKRYDWKKKTKVCKGRTSPRYKSQIIILPILRYNTGAQRHLPLTRPRRLATSDSKSTSPPIQSISSPPTQPSTTPSCPTRTSQNHRSPPESFPPVGPPTGEVGSGYRVRTVSVDRSRLLARLGRFLRSAVGIRRKTRRRRCSFRKESACSKNLRSRLSRHWHLDWN